MWLLQKKGHVCLFINTEKWTSHGANGKLFLTFFPRVAKYLKNKKHISLHLAQKYTDLLRAVKIRHKSLKYSTILHTKTSSKIYIFDRFLELRSRKTVHILKQNFPGQISVHILALNEGYCLYVRLIKMDDTIVYETIWSNQERLRRLNYVLPRYLR